MYLRQSKGHENGKTHTSWRLVRSVRRDRKVMQETVPVRLDRVRVERTRSFGDVHLGWTLWRGLGLDRNAKQARRHEPC
jgi:hypothetical protein